MSRSAAREAASAPGDIAALMSGLGLRIESRPVSALIPYAKNARTHSDEQIALIAGSIRSFGFTNPILVDGGNGIIAGHGRLAAARKLGLATVPVIELSHLSERDKRALIIADNKLTERAGWGSMGAVPRRSRLCLAWRAPRRHGCRDPHRIGLRYPLPDHLGEGPAGPEPWR